MPSITPIDDAPAHFNLHPASAPTNIGLKPVPTSSDLAPWTFKYAPAPDGKDMNLLIMFHGLGDNAGPFFQLAKEVNLPSTAILSLQGPLAIPLMETPTYWSWYQTFSPTLNPLPSPSPAPTVPKLQALIETLTRPTSKGGKFGWERRCVHLFGWGQGGSMALSLAREYQFVGESATVKEGQGQGSKQGQEEGAAKGKEEGKGKGKDEGGRLGSVVSICGPLLDVSTPSSTSSSSASLSSPAAPKAPTPVAFFTRLSPSSAAGKKQAKDVQDAFMDVQILRPPASASAAGSAAASKDGMLRGKDEWIGVMRFWAANLARDETGAMRNVGGGGEVYEVR